MQNKLLFGETICNVVDIVWMCGFCILCDFASLDVVWDELYDCA